MADSIIGLGGYNPYSIQEKAQESASRYSDAITKPMDNLGKFIDKQAILDKNNKIDSILTNPPKLENGDTNYKKLGDLLLPWDRDLAMKYFDLAKDYELKREAILAKQAEESLKKQEREQKLSNKFDLSTQEGKVAWKETYLKLQTATYQPGFETAPPDIKDSILNQMKDLETQASGYPELLSSIGKTIKTNVDLDVDVKPKIELSSELDRISVLLNSSVKSDKGVINEADLVKIKNTEVSKLKDLFSGKSRGELDDMLSEFITTKKEEEKSKYNESVAINQRAKEDSRYTKDLGVDAYKNLQSSPEYTSYIAAKNAIEYYDNSAKSQNDKRKFVYDFIKSYNTGTVLDSELASTMGGASVAQGLINSVKKMTGLEQMTTISDASINSIYNTVKNSLSKLQNDVDKKSKELKSLYGVKNIPGQKTEDNYILEEGFRKKILNEWYVVKKINGKLKYVKE